MKRKKGKSSVVTWHEMEPTKKQWDAFVAAQLKQKSLEEKVHD